MSGLRILCNIICERKYSFSENIICFFKDDFLIVNLQKKLPNKKTFV